jgi:hypothetical protein
MPPEIHQLLYFAGIALMFFCFAYGLKEQPMRWLLLLPMIAFLSWYLQRAPVEQALLAAALVFIWTFGLYGIGRLAKMLVGWSTSQKDQADAS